MYAHWLGGGRMTREPFMAHSELTNEIYIIVGKEKYCVTEQAIKAVMAIKALEQEDILDKIRAEIEDLDIFYDNDYFSSNRDAMFKCSDVLQIIDKYRK
jgi:hypothetical protein